MKTALYVGAVSFSVAIVATLLVPVGCDQATDLGGITIDPSTITISGADTGTVFFTANVATNDPLALPLTWSVSDGALGAIISHAGVNAVYKRTEVDGINVVTVRNPAGAEGIATITQTTPAVGGLTNTIVVTPATVTISLTNSSSVSFTAAASSGDLALPLEWRVDNPLLGAIVDSGGFSAVYVARGKGLQVVHVSDQAGAEGVASVQQNP